MIECTTISAMLPKSWKKSFNSRVVIPAKMRFCIEYSKGKHCDRYNNQIKENQEKLKLN